MDNEGKIKELNAHFDDYATQFLTARSTYYVLKVDSKYLIIIGQRFSYIYIFHSSRSCVR